MFTDIVGYTAFKEKAFNYLDQAFKTNDVVLIWLKKEPSFAKLHGDPAIKCIQTAGF